MASSVIHMCVASEINKKINRNLNNILLGSIAPDISKHIGKTKRESHFLDNEEEIPNLELFLIKYKKHIKDDFVLGYYIHLYTDYLWFKYFKPDFVKNEKVYLLDGTEAAVNEDKIIDYFYNDYTNLNKILIENYKLKLGIFQKKNSKLKNIIKEIPMNDLQLIIDKTNQIIIKTKEKKSYVFDLERINKFINASVDAIISNLEDIEYIKTR